jgi:predicted metal-binding protein
MLAAEAVWRVSGKSCNQSEVMRKPIKSRSTPWERVILLCGKCSRKLGGGFGSKGEDSLRTVLRAELKEQGYGRSVRIIETRCMGICRRKAVTMLDAGRPGTLYTMSEGTAVAEILHELEESRAAGHELEESRAAGLPPQA